MNNIHIVFWTNQEMSVQTTKTFEEVYQEFLDFWWCASGFCGRTDEDGIAGFREEFKDRDGIKTVDPKRIREGFVFYQIAKPSPKVNKCIVKDCSNQSDKGHFLCDLCYGFIVKGEGDSSQAYRNALRVIGNELFKKGRIN